MTTKPPVHHGIKCLTRNQLPALQAAMLRPTTTAGASSANDNSWLHTAGLSRGDDEETAPSPST